MIRLECQSFALELAATFLEFFVNIQFIKRFKIFPLACNRRTFAVQRGYPRFVFVELINFDKFVVLSFFFARENLCRYKFIANIKFRLEFISIDRIVM